MVHFSLPVPALSLPPPAYIAFTIISACTTDITIGATVVPAPAAYVAATVAIISISPTAASVTVSASATTTLPFSAPKPHTWYRLAKRCGTVAPLPQQRYLRSLGCLPHSSRAPTIAATSACACRGPRGSERRHNGRASGPARSRPKAECVRTRRMATSAQAVFRVCSHLCVPACGVLAGALAASVSRSRRLAAGAAGVAGGSAHRRALAAHVATLLAVQIARTLYLFQAIPCPDAVPVQNYIQLSAFCWLHTICINFVLSFRGNHNARDSYINFLFGLAYAWCTPMVLLVTLERHVEGKWLAFPDLLFDIKTCLFDEPPILTKGRDISLQLAILKGITVLISSCFFVYLSYKTGFKKRRAVLCQEDSNNISDVNARQLQALKYILTMVATGAVEVTLDVATWYLTYRYSLSLFIASHQLPLQPTPSPSPIPEGSARLLLAQWVTLSVSLGVDFFRSLMVLELMWWGGPGARREARGGEGADADSLPPYELATQMPRPPPRALAVALPPPSYASVFGERGRRAEDEAALLGDSSSSLAPSTPPSLSPAPSPSPPASPAPASSRDALAPLRMPGPFTATTLSSTASRPPAPTPTPALAPTPAPERTPTHVSPQSALALSPPALSSPATPAPAPPPTHMPSHSAPALSTTDVSMPTPTPTPAPEHTPTPTHIPSHSSPTLRAPTVCSPATPVPAPASSPADSSSAVPTPSYASSPAASSLLDLPSQKFTSTSV